MKFLFLKIFISQQFAAEPRVFINIVKKLNYIDTTYNYKYLNNNMSSLAAVATATVVTAAATVVTEERIVEVLPALYANNSHGREKVWHARILESSTGEGIYEIEHGQFGGKLQLTRRVVSEGKNLGKKNETTPLEQATGEIRKKWMDKQKKEGYSTARSTSAASAGCAVAAEDSMPAIPASNSGGAPLKKSPEMHIVQNKGSGGGARPTIVYPMLAKTYKPDETRKNGITFPCYTQPKLDGLRCLVYINAANEIVTQSRTGGIFDSLAHIKVDSTYIFTKNSRIVLDGELYTPDIPFENLAGLIKKKKITDAEFELIKTIGYHVYDCILLDNLNATYEQRMIELNNLLAPSGHGPIQIVPTTLVQTPEEFYRKFQEYTADGYEGAMLRNHAGPYKQNYRSNDLQKYKEFQEDEFEIVGFTQGDGRDEGTVIWVCRTPEGREFNVRPKGTVEFRRDLFENAAQYVGQKLTVIFQELSEMGVPRFPVGKSVRFDGD